MTLLSVTGRLLRTWLRVTLLLGLLVLVAGWVWGFGSHPFTLAVVSSVVVELVAIRGLMREWEFYFRHRWWWFG